MSSLPSQVPCTGAVAGAHVLAYATVRASAEQITALRRNPGAIPGRPIPPILLRHVDDQTVVVVAAVIRAMEQHGLMQANFADWGAIAAPCFLGRAAIAEAVVAYRNEGAWGVSAHVVPHRLLHAVSGMLTQVLGLHGPNFGVGGGPGGLEEAILTALGMLGAENLPGLWLIASGHDPEPVIDTQGLLIKPGGCQAIALALTPPAASHALLRLRFAQGPDSMEAAPLTLESLRDTLCAPAGTNGDKAWTLQGLGKLELSVAERRKRGAA